MRVQLADEDERSDRVRTSFLSNYPDLEQFRIAIAALIGAQNRRGSFAKDTNVSFRPKADIS